MNDVGVATKVAYRVRCGPGRGSIYQRGGSAEFVACVGPSGCGKSTL